MASSLPAKLRIPTIVPFVSRAAQLEKYKPIISYWCSYYVVNQILSKGLHKGDSVCETYTVTLMDKLEQAKNESSGNDAIEDDVAAKAYCEQFALETFQKADTAIHTNNAARATIDTFQAAVVFLELSSIWQPLDPETTSRIKYAKYHAVRIAKAIKAGEDPNASNPVDEMPPQGAVTGAEDVEMTSPTHEYKPPSVEDAPDSMQPSRPGSAPQVQIPSAPRESNAEPDVSPIEPAEDASRQGSVGGGYFPAVPTFTSETSQPSMPTVGANVPPSTPSAYDRPDALSPSAGPSTNGIATPRDFYTQPAAQPPPTVAPAQPRPAPAPQAAPRGAYLTDDDSIMKAQKHAKWAMSALNFEDVDTAVKELRLALQTLGAS